MRYKRYSRIRFNVNLAQVTVASFGAGHSGGLRHAVAYLNRERAKAMTAYLLAAPRQLFASAFWHERWTTGEAVGSSDAHLTMSHLGEPFSAPRYR